MRHNFISFLLYYLALLGNMTYLNFNHAYSNDPLLPVIYKNTTIIPVGKTTLIIDRQRRSSHHIDAAPATQNPPKDITKKGVNVGSVESTCSR